MRLEKYIRSFGWPEDTEQTEYRMGTREDAVELNELFNRVFHQQRPLEHYLWKAFGAPAGEPVIAYARDRSSGRMVSAMTGIRRRAWLDGQEVETIQTCETCADSSARGGGKVFQDVIKGGMSRAADDQGIYWAYGGQSNRPARVVGARWFGYLNPVTLVPLELRLSLVPALVNHMGPIGRFFGRVVDYGFRAFWKRRNNGFKLEESLQFGPEFDLMWERHRDKFKLALSRDAATLHWRYKQNPAWKHRTLVAYMDGEPCGYVIWREWAPDGVPVATVLDLWDGNDPDLAEALLDGVRREVWHDCAFVQVSVMEGRPQQQAICRFRSCRRSPHLEPDFVQAGWTQGGTPGQIHEPAVAMLDVLAAGDSWYYTPGDSDLRD